MVEDDHSDVICSPLVWADPGSRCGPVPHTSFLEPWYEAQQAAAWQMDGRVELELLAPQSGNVQGSRTTLAS